MKRPSPRAPSGHALHGNSTPLPPSLAQSRICRYLVPYGRRTNQLFEAQVMGEAEDDLEVSDTGAITFFCLVLSLSFSLALSLVLYLSLSLSPTSSLPYPSLPPRQSRKPAVTTVSTVPCRSSALTVTYTHRRNLFTHKHTHTHTHTLSHIHSLTN